MLWLLRARANGRFWVKSAGMLSLINSELYSSKLFPLFSLHSFQHVSMYHYFSQKWLHKKSSLRGFPLRSLKKKKSNIEHLFSSFLPSYQEQVCILSFDLSFRVSSIFAAFLTWTLRREFSIIWVCHPLPSRYIALNYKPPTLYLISLYSENNIDPAEILNHTEVKFGVSKASLDKPET